MKQEVDFVNANKITLNGEILIDLTQDTVAPEYLVKGYKAHDKSGAVIEGAYEGGTALPKYDGEVVIEGEPIVEDERGIPIEIDTLDSSLLIAENAGKLYKCNNKLYEVNKITSLKGLTIKFNKHITPCPVIGENDVFECSGFFQSTVYASSEEGALVTDLRKRLSIDPATTANFSFTMFSRLVRINIYYDPNSREWLSLDENSWSVVPTECNITEFDCPALNENTEFIEWVFANAKVYQKIEWVNDVKSFKLNNSWEPLEIFSTVCGDVVRDATGIFSAQDWLIWGQYTASVLINGELITKTFSRFSGFGTGSITFSRLDNDETLSFNLDYNSHAVTIKYNDVVLDDTPTFTRFDGMFNQNYYFLAYVLGWSEYVVTEYKSGLQFIEANTIGV